MSLNSLEQSLPWFTAIEKMVKQKSYKPILLLSVIAELEQGNIKENNITLTESITERFNAFYKEIGNENAVKKAHLPYYYLKTDLWSINWKSGASQKCPSSDRGARNQIDSVSFKHGFFEPLKNQQIRNIIKERLFFKAEEDIRQKDHIKNEFLTPPKNISEVIENNFGKLPPIIEEERKFVTDSLTLDFAEEKVMQKFLVARWDDIPEFRERNLQIFRGADIGVEYNTETAGRIDILAEDKNHRNFTVIELKRGLGGERHLGQLLRYMGWVRTKISEGKNVFGLLIASKFKESIQYAIQELQTVSLMEYELQFRLLPVKFL